MARVYGEIPGVPCGTTFEDRRALHDAGVHRPLQAGISGSPTEGADSIVVSGRYVDDDDRGDVIIYTGHGGNDPTTGKQIADQKLEAGNRALTVSQERAYPVRVIRGSKAESQYAPPSGYRYDGLYEVENHWQEVGRSGFEVFRFELLRRPDQPEIVPASAAEVDKMNKEDTKPSVQRGLAPAAEAHVTDVGASLALVVESVGLLASDLGESIGGATSTGDFKEARRLLGLAEQLDEFKAHVEELILDWDNLGRPRRARRSREDASNRRRRRRTRKVSPEEKTSQSEFLKPILQVLVDLGGVAPRAEVLAELERRMKNDFKDADLQPMTNRATLWVNTVSWARTQLVKDGYMVASSSRGIWEISDAGRSYLEEQAGRGG